MAGDTRPHLTPADDRVQAIGFDTLSRLDELIGTAFDQVTALPGHPGERENDALSLVAVIASRAAMQLTCRLGDCNRIPVAAAAAAAHKDLTHRMNVDLVTMLAMSGGRH